MIKTIEDIAKIVGVSVSTVSRALNNNPNISNKTKNLIQKIAKLNKFEANQRARNLSLKRSNTIGLIFPGVDSNRSLITDPFLIELLQGITNAMLEYEHDLLIVHSKNNETEIAYKYLNSKRVDGLIIAGSKAAINSIFKNLGKNAPVIIWGRSNTNFCYVDCDNVTGGYLATEHLIKRGCKKIVFLGGIKGEPELPLRYKGFKNALFNNGLSPIKELCIYANYKKDVAYEKIIKLIRSNIKFDGVFACSDLMAFGAMNAIKDSGLNIPADIAVIGFDNILISEYCSPSLTTVKQDIFKSGETLVHNLMKYMKDGIKTATILPVELVMRNSG
jgi:DNA-binding LacI/PurR family transcriptional regulator